MIRMNRSVSILGTVVVIMVTLLATVAVAFAAPDTEGGRGQTKVTPITTEATTPETTTPETAAPDTEGGRGQTKVTICHNGHTITVGAPGAAAHLLHHDGDAAGACTDKGTTPEPPEGTAPALTTDATVEAALDEPISDTATLDVPDGTTGNIVFKLYGPFTAAPTATDCTAAKEITVASSTKTVPDDEDPAGSGNYTSDPYTPTAAGIYNWTATFTPDSGQGVDPSGEIGCGEAAEQSVVNGGATTLTLTTQATPSVTLGEPISDTATLSGGDNPTGTITFNVYGPDDEDCSGDPAFTSEVDVNGEGDYSSKEFVPSAAGTYRWTAE